TVSGASRPAHTGGLRPFPRPYRGFDGNIETVNALAKYVPHGSNVAIYSLSTFKVDENRIYDPPALNVAALQGNYGFNVGYIWDIDAYDSGITRLRQANFHYLLLDSLAEPASNPSSWPYNRFIAQLQQRALAGEINTPGLRVVSRFKLRDRDQVLFRILPLGSGLGSVENGARGIASDNAKGFPILNLNDGTDAAWGSTEGKTDVYAGIVLPSPQAIREVRLRLFTPNGRA